MSINSARTTVVGGRPNDDRIDTLPISVVEYVLKLSAGDLDFRAKFLKERTMALEGLGLDIDPFDAVILNEVSESQFLSLVKAIVFRYKKRSQGFLG